MPAIDVTDLQKTFQSKRKTAGISGSVRSLFKPEYSSVEAVRRLTFRMDSGELLGFIGPNGAGKSTTIKMLTGILHPTDGDARLLGYTPWKDRQKLAYHIGTVFGQRPQLWYHLPAIDTFTLFGKIYEMDDRETKRRIGQLAETFEIQDLLETPVRKLSLGQRMRCEVAASLLHRPKLILLDEPSIGLTWSPNNTSVMRSVKWQGRKTWACSSPHTTPVTSKPYAGASLLSIMDKSFMKIRCRTSNENSSRRN